MSVRYDKIRNMMEKYLNVIKKNEVETMYGKNTTIKVHSLNFSPTSPSLFIEVVIVLGDEINETVLDRRLLDYLVQDMVPYFFPETESVKVMTRWDV